MLRLSHVVAGYGDTVILRDISLSVPTGSVVALLGPNGAGKTTLLKVASGLIASRAGEIECDGVRLTGARPEKFAQAGVCHVPEGRGIFKTMTVKENLLLQAPKGQEKDALERGTSVFPRLGERLGQRAGTLSGGEQQMLAVTRAYVAKPSVVLLDEVSLGLAPVIVDDIFVFLRQLADGGTSLLLVEQYVGRALEIADFVFLLSQGEIAFAGETAEIDEERIFRSYVGA